MCGGVEKEANQKDNKNVTSSLIETDFEINISWDVSKTISQYLISGISVALATTQFSSVQLGGSGDSQSGDRDGDSVGSSDNHLIDDRLAIRTIDSIIMRINLCPMKGRATVCVAYKYFHFYWIWIWSKLILIVINLFLVNI